MPRMPGALWRPLPHTGQKMLRHDILCWHTMVGSLGGTDSYFRSMAPGGTASHFGTGPDGDIIQWTDTDYWAWANYAGSGRIVSVETADFGAGFPKWNTNDASAVPAWTPAQVEAHAHIAAWVAEVHDIPLTLVPDSLPTRRGNAYHRQGVPGYIVPGGETWSKSPGKQCPGPRRIAQVPQVIARARQIAAGATTPPEDELPTTKEVVDAILGADVSDAYAGTQSFKNVTSQVWTNTRELLKQVAGLTAAVNKLASAVAGDDLTAEQLKAAVHDAIAESVVQVDVNVQGQQPPTV